VGRLKLTFLQLANDLRDSALINDLHARLRKMANKVDNINDKVEDIHTILFKLKRSGTQPVSDTLTRQEMPLKPEIFHGRDDLVEGIAQLLLREETSRVCILGPGGMGKTSVSLAIVELPLIKQRFPGGNILWVPCIEATSATLLLEILFTQLQVLGDKQVTLEKIISELDTLKQPRLVVFDNFETPWNANQKQVGDILRRLALLSHIAILVTMRGRRPPCYGAIKWQSKEIESTDEAACHRIYHDINPNSKNDPDVATLLSALGHMPFAVTLMANLGAESRSSAKVLLDSWSESGTKILSNDPEQSMDQSIRLSVESDLVKRNPNAILLLAILSLLPAGTTNENLCWWAPAIKSTIPSAIATLSQAALLVENRRENSASPVLFVVPVVQSFMQQQNRITQEVRKQVHLLCCEYVLKHACRLDDPTFNDKSKALLAEDTNIQSIIFGSHPSQLSVTSHRTMEALIAFNWYRCDTKPNLEIADHVVMAAKASGVQRFIASAVWCLGLTYYRIGNFDTSHNYIQEAYHFFNTLPRGEVESKRLGGLCGIDLVETARFVLPADEVVPLARDVEKKCTALSDDLVHGYSLLKLGVALSEVQQWKEALYYMDRARTVFKAGGDTFNLASAYQVISWVELGEHRPLDALDSIEEAWKYAELSASRILQTNISLDFGRILFNNNRDTEAWKHFEIALINASYIGDRHHAVRALDYMGYGYIRRGDYQNAYGAYEAAAEKYSGMGQKSDVEQCKKNMANIEWKQGNPDAVVGFYRPSMDSDQTLFYP
jgi:tetratricopeptide (TPR) repeat protein